MAKGKLYSLWFISQDYENNAEFVSAQTRVQYLREAKKLLKSQSEVGHAAVIVDIAWNLEGKTPKAIGAEFLHNDRPSTARMSTYIERRLRQIGLDEGGLPRGIRSKTGRGKAINASEKTFTKKKSVKKKKRATAPRTPKTVAGVLDRIKAKKPVVPCNPAFFRGYALSSTRDSHRTLSGRDVNAALLRFARCDWGDIPASNVRSNNFFSRSGHGPIRGVYQSKAGIEFWIIAEPGTRMCTVLLPHEF